MRRAAVAAWLALATAACAPWQTPQPVTPVSYSLFGAERSTPPLERLLDGLEPAVPKILTR